MALRIIVSVLPSPQCPFRTARMHQSKRIKADHWILLLLLSKLLSLSDASSFHRSSSLSPSDGVSMGTTLVAVCCEGGVVLGADTRTSVQGYVSNRYALKLTPLSPRIVVCRSGSAADTQRLCDEARWELEAIQLREGRSLQVSQVAKLLRSFMLDQNLSASLLCAGCTVEGQGQLYSILPSGALLKHDRYAVSGSGSTYIMGHLDHALSDDLLNEEEAINFVAKSIQLAMDRDGSSGGFVRIYSITPNGRKSITRYPSGHAETTTTVRELPGFASIVSEES